MLPGNKALTIRWSHVFDSWACAIQLQVRQITISFPEAAILLISDGDRGLWPFTSVKRLGMRAI